MLGKPKFNIDDIVTFNIYENDNEFTLIGEIYIIDAYGTFYQNDEVSYDIMVKEGNYPIEYPCLFKHIRESAVKKFAK